MKIRIIPNFTHCNSYEREAIFDLVTQHYDAPEHLLPKNVESLEFPCVVVYNDNNYNINSIIGVTFYSKITDHLVSTYRTVIKRTHRNKGIGTKLNKFIESEFKKMGFKKITCNIYSDNLPSLILKLKRGYLIEGTLKDHDFKGVHEYILGKFL